MAETIESFVAKLQAEGVQAGRDEAKKLREEAQKQAEKILREARETAEKIVADARGEADNVRERSRTELALAARDAVHRLRETLSRALQAVLTRHVEATLQDGEFLSRLIRDVVMQYARADSEGRDTIDLNVPDAVREQLTEWALKKLSHEAGEAGISINLKGSLERAGFEYSRTDATVEVTADSVVELLCEMVGPRLREILQPGGAEKAMADRGAGQEA